MAKPKTKKNLYDIEYNKLYVKVKHVMFNVRFEEDMEIMKWLDSKKSKSAYIKDLIKKDMEAQKEAQDV